MLKTLKLTNYRQHTKRSFEFTPGINTIRGAVEAGKTTIIEAWAYLFFGSKGLAEPLEDVVTYDMPVSALRIEGTFAHLGVEYSAYRGKSGAEVTFGRERVTGQVECTKFFERLFGCNADMAGKLMIAEQVKLRGALEEGPRAAGQMIEDLADFDLFEQIVDLIQTKLPSGATASVEGRIALLRAQAVEGDPVDVAPLKAALATASSAWATSKELVAEKQAALDALDVAQATQILADEKRLAAALDARKARITELKVLTTADLPVAPAAGELAAVRAKIEAQKGLAAAERVHAGLKNATVDVLWDEPRTALDEAITGARESLAALIPQARAAEDAVNSKRITGQNATRDIEQTIALKKSKIIKDNTCAFCQKDLTEVPEVVALNDSITEELSQLDKQLADHKESLADDLVTLQGALTLVNAKLADQGEELRALEAVAKQDDVWERILATAGDNVTVDRSVVPARWTWVGPTDAPQDFAGELAALEKQDRAATAAVATREAQVKQLEQLGQEQETDDTAWEGLDVEEAQDTLVQVTLLKPAVAEARAALERAADATHLAQSALTTAELGNEQLVKVAQLAKVQLAGAEAELLEMQENNALIKKVRAARPTITNQLWNLTLGATSKYFSEVRGIPSAITRDTVFKVNGKPVAGLSGSAKDSLGLAMRVSLVKTFLPTMPFMMLDEPAAACNDERELNMLGLLATMGFDQVLLVTHSNLADAFSDNVITL